MLCNPIDVLVNHSLTDCRSARWHPPTLTTCSLVSLVGLMLGLAGAGGPLQTTMGFLISTMTHIHVLLLPSTDCRAERVCSQYFFFFGCTDSTSVCTVLALTPRATATERKQSGAAVVYVTRGGQHHFYSALFLALATDVTVLYLQELTNPSPVPGAPPSSRTPRLGWTNTGNRRIT